MAVTELAAVARYRSRIEIDSGHGRARANLGARGLRPLRLPAAELGSRQRSDARVLGIERNRRLAAERSASDGFPTRAVGQSERAQLPHGLDREPAPAGLRADLEPSLEHDDVAAGFRQHLRRAQTGGPGTDDDMLDGFHPLSEAALRAQHRPGPASPKWRRVVAILNIPRRNAVGAGPRGNPLRLGG